MTHIHTDMAIENSGDAPTLSNVHGFGVSFSKDRSGESYTLHTPINTIESGEKKRNLSLALSELIERAMQSEKVSSIAPVTVICLGNPALTADSLGAACAKNLIATRAINQAASRSFLPRNISVITPGVSGETGIDAFEIADFCVSSLGCGLIITVDSLKTRSTDRLLGAIQVSTSGIIPGSGVGNHRSEISKRTLGIPIISVGVPTVISSCTLVHDAIKGFDQGISDVLLTKALDAHHGFLVTKNNADALIKAHAQIISSAINRALLGFSEL